MSREEIQKQALDTLIANKRSGIAVSMGVGKTLIGLQHVATNYYEDLHSN
jgi:superfamily II DNA or RNA helicase